MTVLGLPPAENNIFKWIQNLIKAKMQLLKTNPNYPEVLILELAADKPNDIKEICSFIKPDIGVITNIGKYPSHLENFKKIEKIYKEKSEVIKALKNDGIAILNKDNKDIYEFKSLTKAKVISYGLDESADVCGSNYSIKQNDKIEKTSMYFRVNYGTNIAPFEIEGILGKGYVYSFLVAIAVGLYYDMNLINICSSLEKYSPIEGRLNFKKGIKQSIILDDAYNASPSSVENALEVLKDLSSTRKVFVFGDMLELGKESINAHKYISEKIIESKIDYVILVGTEVVHTKNQLIKLGFDEDNILYFENSNKLSNHIDKIISKNDLILFKASHGINLSKVIKKIIQ
ncbi:MAG: UDP-N-acetylmuramoyl-tripeptide--D-alanyl-D-alanine ligase [Candidatus Pacebacteria bacterium]|nr:UDP-N-acetylmuramoyl-tripeptide--D-alanyl-D-alanine ligase [Candidatus Paceibacterota bacterium]